jgi:hypothetical protein
MLNRLQAMVMSFSPCKYPLGPSKIYPTVPEMGSLVALEGASLDT